MPKKRSEFEIQEILHLVSTGLSYREVASKLGIHHKTVSMYARQHGGVPPIKRHWDKPIDLGNGLFTCSGCNADYPLESYPLNKPKNAKPYRSRTCKKCKALRGRSNLKRNATVFFNDRQARIEERANKKGIDFNLPKHYLSTMWEVQNGKCLYTDGDLNFDVPMADRAKSISVDRIDASKGYVVGNVILCTFRANSIKMDMSLDEFKEWMPSWYLKIKVVPDITNKVLNKLGLPAYQVADGDF